MNEIELQRDVTALIARIEPLIAGLDLRVVAMAIAMMCRRCPTLEPYVILALRSQAADDQKSKPAFMIPEYDDFVGKN